MVVAVLVVVNVVIVLVRHYLEKDILAGTSLTQVTLYGRVGYKDDTGQTSIVGRAYTQWIILDGRGGE